MGCAKCQEAAVESHDGRCEDLELGGIPDNQSVALAGALPYRDRHASSSRRCGLPGHRGFVRLVVDHPPYVVQGSTGSETDKDLVVGRSRPTMRDSGVMTAEPEEEPRKGLFRDEVWGDEPEEVDASEVVEELEGESSELARRWHDHPTIVPFKVVGRFIGRNSKRVGITIAGVLLLIAGAAMLVLPGPGLLVIIAGLAVLATEYVWAQRLLRIAREKAEQAKDAVFRKNKKKNEGPTAESREPPP